MKEVAIIGTGTMGSAIKEQLQGNFMVSGFGREDDLAGLQGSDVVIICVKPQSFPILAQTLRLHINQQFIVSIMAGATLPSLIESLGTDRVVRTMPNLALATSQGMTAWYTQTKDVGLDAIQTILGTWGSSLRLESEEQFDAFTALAGSGPAYYFQLAHLLEQAAVGQGFTTEQARQMSLQIFRGAASVIDDNDSAEAWVRRVASKGGTTEAALRVLSDNQLGRVIDAAVEVAAARSRELG